MTKQNDNKDIKSLVTDIDKTVGSMITQTDKYIDPLRRSAFRRFPTIFLLLVAFGAAATIFGFEVFISSIPFLMDRPWLILLVGVSVLILTGRLYKKLS